MMWKIKKKWKALKLKIKLRRIEKATNVRLMNWQRDYALGKTDYQPMGRKTGKTLALIFRTLLWNDRVIYPNTMNLIYSHKDRIILTPMMNDPDYFKNRTWHERELYKYWKMCKDKHIKTFKYVNRKGVGK